MKSNPGRLSLTYFGAFQATDAGKPILLGNNTARALLAYLAVEAHQPRSREEIAGLLWPDHTRINAYGNLRQTLTRLRKAIPDLIDAMLVITPQSLQFKRAAAQLDVIQFEALLAGAAHSASNIDSLREAVALYQGEFLQGALLADSVSFDEWVMFKREQLHRQALDALHTLAGHYESISDHENMRQYAVRQLALEPWREEAHAQLMRALAYAGRPAEALAQYEACRRVLSQELGLEPGMDLRTLADRIRDGKIGRTGSLAPVMLNAQSPKHNLPNQLTVFVGRERELSQILACLAEPELHLLTLVGLGGMGKTRLAMEIARARLSHFPDGVFLVSLAPLTTAAAIVPAIAAALNLSLQGSDTTQALFAALHHKRLLLILDNFEHLLDADLHDANELILTGAQIVVELLQAAPQIQVVVTSRERLNVRGEHIHLVQGLDYPRLSDAALPVPDPGGAQAGSAVRLFVQAARRALPDFQSSPSNLPAVLRICQLVEGMPLGLELAAARLETLPLDAIVTQIEHSADVLVADWRDAPERQRSMRGVFEWSWNLLSEIEQHAFSRLSVYRGGFTLEAAESIAAASQWVLTSLLRKSLLRRSEAGESSSSNPINQASQAIGRYEIHELLRQFAIEKLTTFDLTATQNTHEKHCVYYLTLAGQKAVAMYSGAPQHAASVRADVDNIRQACQWAVAHARLKLLHDYTPSLSSIFNLLGLLPEGRRLMQTFAELGQHVPQVAQASDREWAAALTAKALVEQARYLATENLHKQAAAVAQQALGQARLTGDIDSQAGALMYWGECLTELGDIEAGQHQLSQALSLAEAAPAYHAPQPGRGTPVLKAMILTFLAGSALLRKCYAEAQTYGEHSLRLCADARDWLGQARVAGNLGIAYNNIGHYGQAKQYCEQAYALMQPFGHSLILQRLSLEIGRILVYCGDHAHAHSWLQQALSICRSLGDGLGEARTLVLLSRLACNRGDYAAAHQSSQLSTQMAREAGNPQLEAESLSSLGDALIGLHQPHDAALAYQHALSLYGTLGNARLAAEPKTALAGIALADGNLALAQALVDEILPVLDAHPRSSLDEPFSAYLICVRVLQAGQQHARATAVLQATHTLLQAYAARIDDAVLRHSFMEQVPAHRELRRCFAEQVGQEPLGVMP